RWRSAPSDRPRIHVPARRSTRRSVPSLVIRRRSRSIVSPRPEGQSDRPEEDQKDGREDEGRQREEDFHGSLRGLLLREEEALHQELSREEAEIFADRRPHPVRLEHEGDHPRHLRGAGARREVPEDVAPRAAEAELPQRVDHLVAEGSRPHPLRDASHPREEVAPRLEGQGEQVEDEGKLARDGLLPLPRPPGEPEPWGGRGQTEDEREAERNPTEKREGEREDGEGGEPHRDGEEPPRVRRLRPSRLLEPPAGGRWKP